MKLKVVLGGISLSMLGCVISVFFASHTSLIPIELPVTTDGDPVLGILIGIGIALSGVMVAIRGWIAD